MVTLEGENFGLSGIFSDKNDDNKLKVRLSGGDMKGEKMGIGDTFKVKGVTYKISDIKRHGFLSSRKKGKISFVKVETEAVE